MNVSPSQTTQCREFRDGNQTVRGTAAKVGLQISFEKTKYINLDTEEPTYNNDQIYRYKKSSKIEVT